MRRASVVLSGCGYLDGAEVTEAVLSLFFLEREGFTVQVFAPDGPQHHVVQHQTGEEVPGASRNVLEEAARIARGQVRPLEALKADEAEALVLPGGFGAAKNLSTFAFEGPEASLHPELVRAVDEFQTAKKPILALCIAPATLALAMKAKGRTGCRLTIGEDAGTAAAIEALGQVHVICPVDACVVDEDHRVISAPAYMYDASRAEVGAGIEKAVRSLAHWF